MPGPHDPAFLARVDPSEGRSLKMRITDISILEKRSIISCFLGLWHCLAPTHPKIDCLNFRFQNPSVLSINSFYGNRCMLSSTLGNKWIWHLTHCTDISWTSLVAQMVKNLPAIQETQVWFLGHKDPLEKGMATDSRILAWRLPWMEEPSRLQSMGSQRVGHDWVTNTSTNISYTFYHKWPHSYFKNRAFSWLWVLHPSLHLTSFGTSDGTPYARTVPDIFTSESNPTTACVAIWCSQLRKLRFRGVHLLA